MMFIIWNNGLFTWTKLLLSTPFLGLKDSGLFGYG